MLSFNFFTPGAEALELNFDLSVPPTGNSFEYQLYTPALEPTLQQSSAEPNQDPATYDPALSKQKLLPSKLYNLSAPRYKCTVGGLDASEYVESWDAAEGVGKQATGSLVLAVPSYYTREDFAFGKEVTLEILEDDGEVAMRLELFNIQSPAVVNDQGQTFVTLSLGGRTQLASASNTKLAYCGTPPPDVANLARNVAYSLGGTVGHLPVGHSIEEVLEDQGFRGMEALVDAYAVTNHDVWENLQGHWQAKKRVKKDPLYVAADWYLKNTWQPPNVPVASRTVVRNTYNREVGYVETSEESESFSDNYNPGNTLPWFAGGWTYTHTTVYKKGASVVKTLAKTYGYIPVSFPVDVSDLPSDACEITSSVATAYGEIARETLENHYAGVTDRTAILWKTERQIFGLNAYQRGVVVPGTGVVQRWESFKGLIARDLTLYFNTRDEDLNTQVCDHQRTWYQTAQRTWQWGLLPNGQYALQSSTEVSHQRGVPVQGVENKYTALPARWNKTIKTGRYQFATGKWIYPPVPAGEQSDPPNSVFLLPERESVTVEGFYDAPDLTLPPIAAKRLNKRACRCLLDYDYASVNRALTNKVTDAVALAGLRHEVTVSGDGVTLTQPSDGTLRYSFNVVPGSSRRYILLLDTYDIESTLSLVPTLIPSVANLVYQRVFEQGGIIAAENVGYLMPSPTGDTFQSGQAAYGSFSPVYPLMDNSITIPNSLDLNLHTRRGILIGLDAGYTGSFSLQVVTTSQSTYTQTFCLSSIPLI